MPSGVYGLDMQGCVSAPSNRSRNARTPKPPWDAVVSGAFFARPPNSRQRRKNNTVTPMKIGIKIAPL